ncbi:MAG: hypothetical protein H5U01_01230, partial [Clostridia bacterium]|nr:hypothetical protein [Clostridia bacterium]
MPRSLADQLSTVLSGVERQLATETDPRKRQALEAQRQHLLSLGAGTAASAASTAIPAASPATGLLQQVQAAKPRTLSVPQITERPGQTVDLSRWFQAIGTQPRQWQTPQPTTPQVFNLQQLQQALQRPLPQLGARTFTWEQLAQALAAQQQAGGVLPAAAQPRFATPE